MIKECRNMAARYVATKDKLEIIEGNYEALLTYKEHLESKYNAMLLKVETVAKTLNLLSDAILREVNEDENEKTD